ncbi:retrovirus-related pol polyprotein from transposon TNT 1-94 [Tanacetum coccineum]
MDVKSAFLNGFLEEEVYVDQLEVYVAKGQEGKVLRLKKALYCLKHAPRAWNTRIDKKLSKYDGGDKEVADKIKSLVGSLRYLTCTRPDILFAVG